VEAQAPVSWMQHQQTEVDSMVIALPGTTGALGP